MVYSDDSAGGYLPTILTVPCFSGAPWDLEKLEALSDLPLKTIRLPEGREEIEEYADFVGEQVSDVDCHVLLGDSFGAVVSLAPARHVDRKGGSRGDVAGHSGLRKGRC